MKTGNLSIKKYFPAYLRIKQNLKLEDKTEHVSPTLRQLALNFSLLWGPESYDFFKDIEPCSFLAQK